MCMCLRMRPAKFGDGIWAGAPSWDPVAAVQATGHDPTTWNTTGRAPWPCCARRKRASEHGGGPSGLRRGGGGCVVERAGRSRWTRRLTDVLVAFQRPSGGHLAAQGNQSYPVRLWSFPGWKGNLWVKWFWHGEGVHRRAPVESDGEETSK